MTRLRLLWIVPAIAGAGCITPDQLSTIQQQATDTRALADRVQAAQARQEQEIADLRARLDRLASGDQEHRADLDLRLKAIEDALRVSTEQGDQSTRRIEALSSEISSLRAALATRGSVSTPPPPAPGAAAPEAAQPQAGGASAAGAGASPEELFNSAYADYSKGNYPLAIRGFEEFLRRYGDTDSADNAMYWIGVCHYDAGEYQQAIDGFDKLVATYPKGDKVPAALLKKGLAYLEMNRPGQGVVQLQSLIERYPSSDEARVARDRLKSLGVKAN